MPLSRAYFFVASLAFVCGLKSLGKVRLEQGIAALKEQHHVA